MSYKANLTLYTLLRVRFAFKLVLFNALEMAKAMRLDLSRVDVLLLTLTSIPQAQFKTAISASNATEMKM